MIKPAIRYYFSVEGETEQWYLQWLQNKINSDTSFNHQVKIHCQVQKDPLKYVKGLRIISHTKITHVCDYESNNQVHVDQFASTIDRMKQAKNSGKNISYSLGYSNFCFELWIILHKIECNGLLAHRDQYLGLLNRAYNENFNSLPQYKTEDNFKRLIGTLTLDNVQNAIQRARTITNNNRDFGYVLQQYKGYTYYRENPSLSIWEAIENILL